MRSRQYALVLHAALLGVVLVGQCQTTSDGLAEEAVQTSRESQRGVAVRGGRVVRRWSFYLDTDEWTVVGQSATGPYMCHKMLCADDFGNVRWHWSAPPTFLAALSKARGGRLVIRRGFFEIVKAGETSFSKGMPFDVSIESGSDGMKVQQFGLVEFGDFALTHSLELDTTGNWTMESGRPADEATLHHVLSTASRMLIRGGYYRGNETAYLKSVELVEPQSVSADEGGEEQRGLPVLDAVADGEVCGNANGQCHSRPQISRARTGSADTDTFHGDGVSSSETGALMRALQEREAGSRSAPGRQVSGREVAGTATSVALSENESTVSAKAGDGWSGQRVAATSERARKQKVEAEMQARRLGLSVSREVAQGRDGDGSAAAARGADATVNGRRAGVASQGLEENTVTWEEADEGKGGGPLSCSPGVREGVRAGDAPTMQDLLRAASNHGLPLKACLVGTQAAFGLSTRAVVYISSVSHPQILPLAQVESVSTDSQGAIVILGADASGSTDDGVQPVLLRGCQMSAFDLDDMTSFFEQVQQLVAGEADSLSL